NGVRVKTRNVAPRRTQIQLAAPRTEFGEGRTFRISSVAVQIDAARYVERAAAAGDDERIKRNIPRKLNVSDNRQVVAYVVRRPAVFTRKVVRICRETSRSIRVAFRKSITIVSKDRDPRNDRGAEIRDYL